MTFPRERLGGADRAEALAPAFTGKLSTPTSACRQSWPATSTSLAGLKAAGYRQVAGDRFESQSATFQLD
jgi:hypothetical protein